MKIKEAVAASDVIRKLDFNEEFRWREEAKGSGSVVRHKNLEILYRASMNGQPRDWKMLLTLVNY